MVSWDTLKFAVQNRTHLFRSGQVDGSTGRTDLDGIVEHPHRETKYRPGPNPHWPVCHRIGPRFIHACHFIYSPGHFIYFHIRWDFILCFTHRTIVSATDQGFRDQVVPGGSAALCVFHCCRSLVVSATDPESSLFRGSHLRILRSAPPAATLQNEPLYGTEECQRLQSLCRWKTLRNSSRLTRRRRSLTIHYITRPSYAHLGSGTLVPGGLDRRPFGRVFGRFRIIGDGDFGCLVRKSSTGGCTGGCTSGYNTDAAQCEWNRHRKYWGVRAARCRS